MVTGSNGSEPLSVLYDGDCGICSATARVLARLDSSRRLKLMPLQAARVGGGPTHEELLERLYAVDGKGRWFGGAHAVVQIARRVPALWIIGVVARLPGAMLIFENVYRVVAANRQRISRLTGLTECQLSTPESGRPAR